MGANATALSLSGVTKRFQGLVAVDGVTIDLASGKLNAIIGPNGAGKRRGVSRTLQIKSVFGGLSVIDNVRIAVLSHERIMAPFRPAGSIRAVTACADEIIDEVGLAAHRDAPAATLSYGDVALLEMALALAAQPKLLLLDEPVCGMGPEETEHTVGMIKEISQRIDVILIEHDMEVVFDIANFIMVMAQGAVLATGTAAEIARDPKVQEAYLGSPEDD